MARSKSITRVQSFTFHITDASLPSTIAVALWSLTPNVTVSPTLKLKLDATYDGGVGKVVVNNPVWSADGRPEAK
jgi:hypothetical protein